MLLVINGFLAPVNRVISQLLIGSDLAANSAAENVDVGFSSASNRPVGSISGADRPVYVPPHLGNCPPSTDPPAHIEASMEIARNLARSPNVAYLHGGQNMLLELNPLRP